MSDTLSGTWTWLNDPVNWQGVDGVPHRTIEHLYISGSAVLIGAVLALPLAAWLGHIGRGGSLTVVISNVSRALPTLALLTIFATVSSFGFGNRPTIIALAVFAVPPLLANTYVGIREIDPEIKEAAVGMGMSPFQVLLKVELPLAVPLIAAGFRTAAVQVVATASLAALVAGGGLGVIITDGVGNQNQPEVVAGGVLVAALALLVEFALAGVQRLVTPAHERRRLRWKLRRSQTETSVTV
ncbi:MAG: ABC transporter permease [Mycobacteriales bacterium]